MKKVKMVILITSVAAIMLTECIWGASTWTDSATWSLEASSDFTTTTVSGVKLGATKTTDSEEWDVYTVSKTMATRPRAKLVNSSGSDRSEVIFTAAAGKYSTGESNTGVIGYAEYLSVKPNALQTGTETIKLQMRTY